MVGGKLKVIYLITSLNMGGAEMMLYHLLKHIDRTRFDCSVVSLLPSGIVSGKIQALGIPVRSLGMRPGRISMGSFVILLKMLLREKPDLVHTWMYHADLMGGVAGFLTGVPVIWAIHNTSLDPAYVKSGTIRVARLNARLSPWIPKQVTVCSAEARTQHINLGYITEIFVTIPNGFDLEVFHPDVPAGLRIRKELDIDRDSFLIGLVARFDPLKDHKTFSEAAAIFFKCHPTAHFLLCGQDITWNNELLKEWISLAGPSANFHLLGPRGDIPEIMNSLDILTLSSSGEAFPNVIGETSLLVGDTGIIVPPRDPQALADGWEKLLSLNLEARQHLGIQARQRIEQNFDIVDITLRYQAIYEQMVSSQNN
jgi:glycosyltransferase involved in cell wall biosynthesis